MYRCFISVGWSDRLAQNTLIENIERLYNCWDQARWKYIHQEEQSILGSERTTWGRNTLLHTAVHISWSCSSLVTSIVLKNPSSWCLISVTLWPLAFKQWLSDVYLCKPISWNLQIGLFSRERLRLLVQHSISQVYWKKDKVMMSYNYHI